MIAVDAVSLQQPEPQAEDVSEAPVVASMNEAATLAQDIGLMTEHNDSNDTNDDTYNTYRECVCVDGSGNDHRLCAQTLISVLYLCLYVMCMSVSLFLFCSYYYDHEHGFWCGLMRKKKK
eukprot:1096979_1